MTPREGAMTETRKKRSDARLRRELYKRAADNLRDAAEWADKNDPTWPKVYAEAGLKLIVAAEAL